MINERDDTVHGRITLVTLINILRGKEFTGALTIEEGKILFINGCIKLASYKNESGELVFDLISSLSLPAEAQVIQLSHDQVELWLTWQKLLYDQEEVSISPLPEVDRRSIRQFLKDNELAHLLVPEGG
jgi:hypothetical protein